MNLGRRIRLTVFSALAIGMTVLAGASFAGTGSAGMNMIRSYAGPCFWEISDWGDLNSAERAAWSTLGWSWAKWDSDVSPPPDSSDKSWDELSGEERSAARMLGFDPKLWDNFDSDTCVEGDDD